MYLLLIARKKRRRVSSQVMLATKCADGRGMQEKPGEKNVRLRCVSSRLGAGSWTDGDDVVTFKVILQSEMTSCGSGCLCRSGFYTSSTSSVKMTCVRACATSRAPAPFPFRSGSSFFIPVANFLRFSTPRLAKKTGWVTLCLLEDDDRALPLLCRWIVEGDQIQRRGDTQCCR